MPDISMCAATTCPLSPRCYRHADSGTKPSKPWQTYSHFPYAGEDCPDFWPVPGPTSPTTQEEQQ